MHSLVIILLAVGGAVTTILVAIRLELLLVVKADTYLVLSYRKRGTEHYRELTDGFFVRLPWQKIRGYVFRGEQVLVWERGACIVVQHCDECLLCDHRHELDVVAYVVSIKFELIDDPHVARSIVLGELSPDEHMQRCVEEAIVRPGQEPLDPQDAALLLWRRLETDDVTHGFKVISVATYVPRI